MHQLRVRKAERERSEICTGHEKKKRINKKGVERKGRRVGGYREDANLRTWEHDKKEGVGQGHTSVKQGKKALPRKD